jgi:hypothetical protein
MGLDITYYRGLEQTDYAPRDQYGNLSFYWMYFEPRHMSASEEHWPGRGAPIKLDAIYRHLERGNFRAGSYSGYGEWRRWLSTIAPLPAFAELINFSDCEGVIGSVVASKLAKDFAEYENVALEKAPANDGDWFVGQYRKWRRAFETASVDGAVEFH